MDIPTTMKALVQLHDGFASTPGTQSIEDLSPYLEYCETEVPTPSAGQALIKVNRAAVNPSDVAFIKGIYGQPRVMGAAAGFEGTGTVVAGDTPLLGQRVSFFAAGSGTWAEYALAPIEMLIPLRPDLSDDDAAGLIVNPITAMAMFDMVREDGAESFVVTAAGSQLGKFLIALGRDAGIPAIAVVRREEQAEALEKLGAAKVLVTSATDFAEQRDAAMATFGPRLLLDAVGDQISADLFFAMPNRARWVSYGRLAANPAQLTQLQQFIFMGKRIEGFWLAAWLRETPPEKAASVIGEAQARFVDARWTTDVNAVVPLSEAMTQLPKVYGDKDGKVLIAP